MKTYYACHNAYADARTGSAGFANSWCISVFKNRADREAFLQRKAHQLARPVTHREADEIYRSGYYCVGKKVPTGGLQAAIKAGECDPQEDWIEEEFA